MEFIHNADYPVKVYFVEMGQDLSMLDEDTARYAVDGQGFDGSYRSTFVDLGPRSSQTILVGLGEPAEIHRNRIRTAAFDAGQLLEQYGLQEASVVIQARGDIPEKSVGQCTVEGLKQSSYQFDYYQSEKTTSKLERLGILSDHTDQAAIDEALHITAGAHLARDLVNLRANDLTPAQLAEQVQDLFADLAVEVQVYDQAAIEAKGMEALATVAKGSAEGGRFIRLNYLPEGEERKALTLVGKGMTYDSGGYALKPARSMQTMQTDMAGAGAVVGAIYALASQGVEKNVVGLIPAAENMISGRAMKNGDIISSLKGSTIEINNTDAEGRLILADALYYAATEVNCSAIIDLATLTGAAISALGNRTAAVMTNQQELLDTVLDYAQMTGETMWQLPRLEEMYDKIKGDFADLNNAPTGGGGTITAGLFLEHFVEDKDWVHIDIAGPAWTDKAYNYYKKGATGFPVKTLYNLAKNYDA